jgi:hypothetical protein
MAPSSASEIDTLILIDVDGVLNVGLKDPDSQAPLIFDMKNVKRAFQRRVEPPEDMRDIIERLISVAERPLQEVNGERATYLDLVSGPTIDLSRTLLQNLAMIISAAGDRCGFVLSSMWRKPGKEAQVRALEMHLSGCLGRHFCFNGRTPLRAEHGALDRLESLGDYLSALQAKRGKDSPRLRVLVLDDFSITPLDGWICQDFTIGSTNDMEAYLSYRAGGDVDVRVVHTYEQWPKEDSDVPVEVGMGLQRQHVNDAEVFFSGHPVDVDARTAMTKERVTPSACDRVNSQVVPMLSDKGMDATCGENAAAGASDSFDS